VAIGADLGRPLALEIGRGQIIEHHVDLEREQVAQRDKERVLDLDFALQQLIERAVPPLELAQRHPHPRRPAGDALAIVAPFGEPSPAMAVADKVGLKPTRQPMLAARRGQPIDDQHQSAIAQGRGVATGRCGEPVERRFEAELAPQLARHQHRSPVPRRDRANVLTPDGAIRNRLAMEQTHQLVEVEMRRQQVPAAEIEHRAMPRLAVLPKRFDDPHIFVLDPFAAGGADHPQEHGPLQNLSLRYKP